MRKRTLLGLAVVGIAIAVAYRRWSSFSVPERAREVSPIGEPAPGDESIAEGDVAADVDAEEITAGVDRGSETSPGDEEADTGSDRASNDADRNDGGDAETDAGSGSTTGSDADSGSATDDGSGSATDAGDGDGSETGDETGAEGGSGDGDDTAETE